MRFVLGRLLYGLLIVLNRPLNWLDRYCYVRIDKHGTGLGGHIGLWMMRVSANLEARGRR